jgi:hypothetical protein
MNRRSDNYVGTVNHDTDGARRIELVRETISKVNAQLRANGSPTRYRVLVKGRLGKDNPAAKEYRRGGKHWRWSSITIRAEHSTRFDLYVCHR